MKGYEKKERAEHIKRFEESGLSKTAYAKKEGINAVTFYSWFHKAETKQGGFIELRQKENKENSGTIKIKKGDVIIQVPLSSGVEELKNIFTALGGIK